MSTPHNDANLGDIAKTVLLPGDPLRAKYIAEHFLENPKQFNKTRNMFGFTGTYKGKEVSVMGSGMGQASLGIYVSELFKFYGVEQVIRIGSAGAYSPDCKIFDVVIAQGACTNSNFAVQYQLDGTFSAISSYDLLEKAVAKAKEMGVRYHVGNIYSSDLFYSANPDIWKKWADLGCLCVEMESYALFCLAAQYHKKALSILTISDSFLTSEVTTAEQREKSFTNMMEIALSLA
ncbi:MAG: purine-nucleoside phosphorylase [Bacilli bacterium]|nr:purine-nucleoside phosphorylase [Bacilli bacterium]